MYHSYRGFFQSGVSWHCKGFTRINSIKSSLDDVIQLHDESTRFSKKRGISSDILDVSPNNTVAAGWFGRAGTPDLRHSQKRVILRRQVTYSQLVAW
jgi:hypothetical protein